MTIMALALLVLLAVSECRRGIAGETIRVLADYARDLEGALRERGDGDVVDELLVEHGLADQ